MNSDIDLLRRLDGLQGTRIDEAVWRKADQSLRLTIADVYGSLDGRPEYPGPAPGVMTFVGIGGFAVETLLFRGAFRISGIDVETEGDGLAVRVRLSEPGADVRFRCRALRLTLGSE